MPTETELLNNPTTITKETQMASTITQLTQDNAILKEKVDILALQMQFLTNKLTRYIDKSTENIESIEASRSTTCNRDIEASGSTTNNENIAASRSTINNSEIDETDYPHLFGIPLTRTPPNMLAKMSPTFSPENDTNLIYETEVEVQNERPKQKFGPYVCHYINHKEIKDQLLSLNLNSFTMEYVTKTITYIYCHDKVSYKAVGKLFRKIASRSYTFRQFKRAERRDRENQNDFDQY